MLKLKKTSLLLVLMLLLSVIAIGCSNDSEGTDADTTDKVIEISYGHGFMPDTPHHKSAIKFKEEVEKATNGKVKVNVFPSGQLGSAREMFEGLQMGTQEIALVPTARISGFAPELQLFDLPFLFPDRETGYKIMDGEVGTELLDKLAQQNVKGVAFYEDGYKHFTANKAIANVNDFKGVKFRTMESPIIISQFKALGAVPVPIDFGELYNSLQLGVVQGQENPLVTIESNKFYEVQSHLTLSEHAYLAHVLIFSNDWYNKLPEDIQKILYEKGREIAQWQRQAVQDEEVKYIQTIKEAGTTIIELTDEQKNDLKEATKSVHQEYSKQFGSEILEKTYAEIEKYQ
ncbi:TRAP transporter substrate-binding protein [Proteiniborus sp. MB09-C3]|uniref:TRAP transporter substrate-binding protein n=1 Tax=Proteiniborus sp. MB09-C3 TaxID=3050072 RepID=UPI0025562FD1|nr:TRAP transporter substrate-binding protein [Proteiniborus sp. MB09-C3]WIV13019.1 TRAP transporter substrate-binding protein [Proteiniborus sp. MB09-C3]